MAQPTFIPVPYHSDASAYFIRIADLPYAAWFDSGGLGRYDIMTAAPSSIVTDSSDQEPIAAAKDLIASMAGVQSDLPFVGGLLGFIGYGFLNCANGERSVPGEFPNLQLGTYDWSLVVDHSLQKATICLLPSCSSELQAILVERFASDYQAVLKPFKTSKLQSNLDKKSYLDGVARIQSYINAGDCYQVNFAQRFSAVFEGDPLSAYLALRPQLPGPYSGYLACPEGAVLSFSPEQFIGLEGQRVRTKPIKGTRPRHADAGRDQLLATELLNSAKDKAENLMIVDLLRNDLSKHCVPYSVKVDKLCGLESFHNVHHLVSTISGELEADCHPLDLLLDAFPGGSITGAPKKRAMEIIAEVESDHRSVYCGSFLYLSANGLMDSNIAIRTIVCHQGELFCWGGGGIVADSDPESEYQESLDKIQVLIDGLQAMGRLY